MRRVAAGALLLGFTVVPARRAAATEPGEPPSKSWQPTASLAVGAFEERLRVRVDGVDYDSFRTDDRVLFALGLGHRMLRLGPSPLWLEGHATLGVGPTFESGHWHVPVREDVTIAYVATRWLTLRGGLGVGVTIDATEPSQSFADFGIPLGATFFDAVELTYRPALSIPLGNKSAAVFGGERSLQAAFAFLPFEVGLCVRPRGLGW
jgi:hypothetical protein